MSMIPMASERKLPHAVDGLGIFPIAENAEEDNVYPISFSNSTSLLPSLAHNAADQARTQASGTQTKNVRTNLKEIKKSPIPHRFHLVPSRKRFSKQASAIPRFTVEWKRKGPQASDAESVSQTSLSPRSCEAGTESPSPNPTNNGGEPATHCTILEDLVSEALDSPVFESYRSPSDTPSPHTASFTLVQEQPTNSKPKRFSVFDSIQETSEPSLEDVPKPQDTHAHANDVIFSSPASIVPSPETTPDVGVGVNAKPLPDLPPPSAFSSTFHTLPTHPSSNDTLLPGTLGSISVYSQPSDSDSTQAINRRNTEGSFSCSSSSQFMGTRRKKFALRRQAIYADYGFQIAFPDSDSDPFVNRQASVGTGAGLSRSGRDPKFSHSASRSTSACVFSSSSTTSTIGSTGNAPRSAWSTSTSGASLKSQATTGSDLDNCTPRASDTQAPPDALGLDTCTQTSDRLELFSIQEDFLASNRNPLLDSHAMFITSTPSAKARSALPSEASAALVASGPSGLTGGHLYIGSDRLPWAPLRVVKRTSIGWSVSCSASSLARSSSAFCEEILDRHPLVQAMMDEVDGAIAEWSSIAAARGVVAHM